MNEPRPIFIALKRQFFEAFERGEKQQEYRPWGSRWNEKTCCIGRKVILSDGYGKARRLYGEIIALLKHDAPEFLPGWKECYGNKKTRACVITISIDRAATEAAGWLTTLAAAATRIEEIKTKLHAINLPPYPAGGFVGTHVRLRGLLHLESAKEDVSYLRRQLSEYCEHVGIYMPNTHSGDARNPNQE